MLPVKLRGKHNGPAGRPAGPILSRPSRRAAQNGFTITRMTMPIISTVGTSLAMR